MKNREIKFRVWDKKRNHFLVPWCGKGYEDIDLLYADGNWYFSGGNKLDDNYILQQFTGLLDKNGREIYEGDLIKYKEKMHEHGDVQFLSGQVVYDTDKAAFGIAGIESGEIWNYFTDMVIYNFEVVGNVFEE